MSITVTKALTNLNLLGENCCVFRPWVGILNALRIVNLISSECTKFHRENYFLQYLLLVPFFCLLHFLKPGHHFKKRLH